MPFVRAPHLTHRTVGLLLTLAVLAAPFLPTQANAREARQHEPAPFFLGDERNPYRVAGLAILAPTVPLTGPYAALADVYAGEHPSIKTWSLQGVMTNKIGRLQAGISTLFLDGFHPCVGSSTLVNLLPELATLRVGDTIPAGEFECWTLIDTDEVRPIPPILLATVEDGTGVVAGSDEADAYDQIVVLANYTSQAAFDRVARKDVTYGHMFNDPGEYRGQVVRIQGRLRRLLRVSPDFHTGADGVNDLYIGYVFNDDLGAHPYRVLFTEWPAGLDRDLLGEKINRDVRVEFSGYFYKKYRYEAGDSRGNKRRDCPMIIGHSLRIKSVSPLTADEEAVTPPPDWAHYLIYIFVGVIAAAILFIVAMTMWFRRSDNQMRRRLMATRAKELVLPPPDASPIAPAAPTAGARTPSRLPFPPRNTLPPGYGDRGGERSRPETGGAKEGTDPAGPDEGAGV